MRSLKKTRKDVSLHDSIGTDKEGNDITLIDILGTEADDVADKVQLKIEKSKIYKNLDILDDGEKKTSSAASASSTAATNGRSGRLRRSWASAAVKLTWKRNPRLLSSNCGSKCRRCDDAVFFLVQFYDIHKNSQQRNDLR
ncbi:ClpP class serine protease [Paenibacillus harenae]|nr:ClpP class serine protease [Paenibacillus harenae]